MGLVSLILSLVAFFRRRDRLIPISALALGLVGVVLSAVNIAGSSGVGTGGGRLGSIAGLALGIIGIAVSALVLIRRLTDLKSDE